MTEPLLLDLTFFPDDRGSFTKTFNRSGLLEQGIDFTVLESYFSVSRKDVIRGLHFQLPPHQHAKIVFCPFGAIMDVLVDLRQGSGTFGRVYAQELSAENHRAWYIPEGFAHGFRALTEGAITYYLVSSEYSRAHDTGILYDSVGYKWAVPAPIVSERDRSFPPLGQFHSPF